MITSRRPLKNYWQDPRVEFIALDFLEPVETIISKMTPYCSDVTHAYFTSYVHTDDFAKLKEFNVPLFESFLTAIDQVARNTLQRVCLQTGGKVSSVLPHYLPSRLGMSYAETLRYALALWRPLGPRKAALQRRAPALRRQGGELLLFARRLSVRHAEEQKLDIQHHPPECNYRLHARKSVPLFACPFIRVSAK